MTNDFIDRFERLAHRNFQRAGMADSATFKQRSTDDPVEASVYIDRAVQFMAGDAVTGPKTVIEFVAPGIIPTKPGGTVTIGAESWKLSKKESDDEASSRWIVEKA
jgi:hypothetical protein